MNKEISDSSSDPPQTSAVSPSQSSQVDAGYQRFFSQNPLPMWIYDLDTLAFLAVNEAAVEHYGYTRDEFLAMTIAEIRPTEDVPTLMENVSAVTDGLDHAGVWRHITEGGSVIYVEITSYTLDFEGRNAELVLAYDVSQRVRTEQALRRHLTLEETISDISTRFVVPTDLDAAIDYAIERMGIFSDASRAYIFQFQLDQQIMDNTHEWCAAGVNPEITVLQGLPMERFHWSLDRLRRGEVVPIPDVSRLPSAANTERTMLRDQGIKSLIMVPLLMGAEVGGFIGFDNVNSAEPWSELDLNLLRVAAELIGNALNHRRAVRALRTSEKNVRSFMNSAVGFAVYRLLLSPGNPLVAEVDFASPSIQEILGVAPDDPFSIWLDRVHPEDRPHVVEAYHRTATHVELFDMTMRIYHPQKGQWRWIRAVSNPVFDDWGKATHFNGLMVDVTELKVAHEEMERLASYDPLTGLPNRRLFRDRLDQALKIAHRHEQTLALLYLDLDNFKRVNDSLGHDAGDRLLQTVAERIRACVRDEDTVSRLGGDEFVVLLSAVHGSSASDRVARKILDALRLPIWLEGQEVVVTGSIGITLIPEDSADPAVILRNADLAMYRAKETGRNRYEFFQIELNQEVIRRLSLEAELRRALDREELILYFQPVVRTEDLEVVGVEALARWQHPEQGLILPDQFIPVAEDSGLIMPIGQHMLRRAIEQLHRLQAQGTKQHLSVAVNLSARQLQDRSLADTIDGLLSHRSVPPNALVLEITESILMDDVKNTSVLLEQLREIGVRISVDDFGTGYSSLSYLKRLPVNSLKVDRSFVRDIPHDKNDMEITAAVIAMAHKLELSVVAEGVETPLQLEFLRTNSCDFAQGFLFGRPMPPEQLAEL